MLSFVIDRVRGVWMLALIAASVAYGWLIIVALPYWDRLEAAQGGSELQTRFLYDAAEAGVALAAVDAQARSDAFIFYALDVPNAVLYGLAIAAMIAFGLRQFRWERTRARGLALLPLVSGAADILENACLTIALRTNPAHPGFWGDAAGSLTAAKFTAGFPAQILGIVFVVLGLIAWGWRALRPSAPPSPS